MENDITKIIQELSFHESQLKAELDQLTSRLNTIADRLTQIQTAKTALGGTHQAKHRKKEDKQNRKAPGQSALEVIIEKILREKNRVPVTDLMQQVKSQLLANGQSRIGLKSLFEKAISSPKFKTDVNQNIALA
jgi:predicted nuclease with TOPRIM domain